MVGVKAHEQSGPSALGQFDREVYPSELAQIQKRRAIWKLPSTPQFQAAADGVG